MKQLIVLALVAASAAACKKDERAVKSDVRNGVNGDSTIRHMPCIDPRNTRVVGPHNWGALCGDEVARLGLQHGVSEAACKGLGGELHGQACVVTTKFVEVALPANPGQPGFFCQGARDPRVSVTTELFDLTQPFPSADGSDEPEVTSVVIGYRWAVSGQETCRLRNPDHDVATGALGCLRGHEQGWTQTQLAGLHDAIWDRLLERRPTTIRWRCLLHPDDPV